MSGERSRAAEGIVEAVRFMRARERDAYLADHCTDPELRRDVDLLLERAASSATEERPLASDAASVSGPTVMHPPPSASRSAPAVASGPSSERLVAAPAFSPGTRVGAFTIDSRLGAGGFGAVYRARDESGRLVALKTVLVPRAGLLHSIRREVLALSRLRHPGIVPIVAEGVHEGLPWYAMELLEGRTLSELVVRPAARRLAGRLPEDPVRLQRILTICHRLCAPLAYLHGEGLVHRDLKPDNVLLRAAPRADTPVLVDFGLTVESGSEAMREGLEVGGLVVGTITYMSPEQVRGEVVDARSDLYALGGLMFELLAARPAFLGLSAEVMRLKQEGVPPVPSSYAEGIPPALDALVSSLLAPDPRQRLGYARDVAKALEGLGVAAEEDPGAPRSRTYLYRPGFAGREDELQELLGAVAALRRGAGGIFLLGGPSGMGKTRLASEAARTARIRGMELHTGECHPSGNAPLQAFRKTLLGISDRCREHGRRETDRILGRRGPVLAPYEPTFASLPGQDAFPPPAELTPREMRLRLWSDLHDTLVELAVKTPVVVVLDDLHWADELSLGFLNSLVQGKRLARSRLLVIATFREEEAPEALRKLAASEGVTTLRLGRMAATGVDRMVKDMLAIPEAPPALAAFLEERSEGNPFYVAQYLRVAVEQGLIARDDVGRWQLVEDPGAAGYEELPLPEMIRKLVVGHLGMLGEGARRIVDAAAVLGKIAPVELVARIAGLSERELLTSVQELLTRQLALEEGSQLGLAHDRIREVAYQELPEERRRALHGLAATSIEELFRISRRPWLSSLALHWERAGETERASTCYQEAAKAAVEGHVYGEAERLFRAYLALQQGSTAESVNARIWFGGVVLPQRGKIPECLEQLERAAREAEDLGEPALRCRALQNMAAFRSITGQTDAALALYEEALALARATGNREREADLTVNLALLQKSRNDAAAARAGWERALEMVKGQGREKLEGIVLGNLANLAREAGELDESARLAERSIELLRKVGDRRAEGATLCNLALLRRLKGEIAGAARACEEAVVILVDIGDRLYLGFALATLASLYADEGRVKDALRHCDRALASIAEIADPGKEAYALLQRMRIERLALGNAVKAAELATRIREINASLGDLTTHCWLACEVGHLQLAEGRPCDSLPAALDLAGAMRPDAAIAARVAALQRAAASPATLFRGELWDEIPPGLQAWLVESRQAAPPPQAR